MTLIVAPDREVVPVSGVTAQDFLRFGSSVIPLRAAHLEKSLVSGFLRFLKAPEEYRKRWRFLEDGSWCPDPIKGQDPDTGYLVRRLGQPGPDGRISDPDKEAFHVSHRLPEFLKSSGVPIEAGFADWLDTCFEVMRVCRAAAQEVAENLDRELPGYEFARRISTPAAEFMHKLRLLWYGGGAAEGYVLGKDHYDRNVFTLHGGDSRPGLVIYDKKGQRYLFRVRPDSALCFPGAKLAKLTGGLIEAFPHGIVATGEGFHEPRWCWVYFVHIELDLEPKDLEVVIRRLAS